ncbi:MAG: right-handed parallel beta-helix repeat-containing protein [Planctomycetota bacterium]
MTRFCLILATALGSFVTLEGYLCALANASSIPSPLDSTQNDDTDETWPVWNITSGSKYDNIQQAINDANDGDAVVLACGLYTGQGNRDIDFQGKPITLRSSDPGDPEIVASTIIDSEGSLQEPHRGFYFHSGEDANSVVSGLTITGGNGAYQGGGINCIFNSSPTITNCVITNNLTKDHGGGIYCGYESSPTITNCIISSNSFNPYGYGGGIYCRRGSSPVITNCIITNNSAIGNSPPGHGRHGGGICCWGDSEDTPSNPIIANCIISGNSAEHRGGGVYAYWSSPTIVNCTIIGNRAYEGGGIGSFREANPTAINCIVRDNTAIFGDQLALINTLRLWSWQEITEMTISYSNIEGGPSDACVDNNMVLNWELGNIDAEPNFVDPGCWDDAGTSTDPNDDFFVVGNYHLLPDSPGVDAGDNASVPTVSIADIDDEARIFNNAVDMGADEMATNPADFNIDGIVGFADIIVLAAEWLDSGQELQSDLVDDGFIDLADYAMFAEQWLHQAKWY